MTRVLPPPFLLTPLLPNLRIFQVSSALLLTRDWFPFVPFLTQASRNRTPRLLHHTPPFKQNLTSQHPSHPTRKEFLQFTHSSLAPTQAPCPSPPANLPRPSARMAPLRSSLPRRRSSLPPASSLSTTPNSSPWVSGDLAGPYAADMAKGDKFAGLADEMSAMAGAEWTTDTGGWEALLDFGGDSNRAESKAGTGLAFDRIFPEPPFPQPMSRSRSDPAGEPRPPHPANVNRSSSGTAVASLSPDQLAQFSADLAWKTILSSIVEVEGVGETSVARVLQEIWQRGGGDAVSPRVMRR